MRDLVEGLRQRLGRFGRLSGIWLDISTRSQNQGMLGHPGAIRIILFQGQSCNFTTLPNMAAGGKAYASRSFYGKLSASTAEARGSGTGETAKLGNLKLVPPAANSLEDLWKERPLCVDGRT